MHPNLFYITFSNKETMDTECFAIEARTHEASIWQAEEWLQEHRGNKAVRDTKITSVPSPMTLISV